MFTSYNELVIRLEYYGLKSEIIPMIIYLRPKITIANNLKLDIISENVNEEKYVSNLKLV